MPERKSEVMAVETVVATPREGKFNKNVARRVRVAGKIPAVVYGAGQDAVAVAVDPKAITKILHSDSGHNTTSTALFTRSSTSSITASSCLRIGESK